MWGNVFSKRSTSSKRIAVRVLRLVGPFEVLLTASLAGCAVMSETVLGRAVLGAAAGCGVLRGIWTVARMGWIEAELETYHWGIQTGEHKPVKVVLFALRQTV